MGETAPGSASSRPLSFKIRRTLDGMFFVIVALLLLAAFVNANGGNVFRVVVMPLDVPNSTLFELLALKRNNGLTTEDEILKKQLLSLDLRRLYLRYGPRTLTFCPVCNSDDSWVFTTHHLMFYVLIPHLLNAILANFIISRAINTAWSPYFRIKALLAAVILMVLDGYLIVYHNFKFAFEEVTPGSLFAVSLIFRPVAFALYNYGLAASVYYHAKGRFTFYPFASGNR